MNCFLPGPWPIQRPPVTAILASATSIGYQILAKDVSFHMRYIKQADYLLLYEQNWLKEGTEALVLKKTAESSK